MTNNLHLQINTVYSDLLFKVHYQSESLFYKSKNLKKQQQKTLFYLWQHSVKSITIQLKQY